KEHIGGTWSPCARLLGTCVSSACLQCGNVTGIEAVAKEDGRMDEQHDASRQAQDIAAQKAPTSSTSPRSATRRASSLVGRRLGDYYLSESLRVGGMAEVYRAQDLVLMREVAVKVLSEAQLDDPAYVERFRTEARRAAALSHPHLVQVYQAGEEEVDGLRVL